jgi:hypothetical protein
LISLCVNFGVLCASAVNPTREKLTAENAEAAEVAQRGAEIETLPAFMMDFVTLADTIYFP